MAIISLIFSVALTIFILYPIFNFIILPIFWSPLSKLPAAHWSTRISALWIFYARYNGKANKAIHDAHERLGEVVLLAPDEVSVNCVDGGIRTVYAGGFEKHDWYPRVFANFGVHNMFSTATSKPHSIRKRMMSNVYSKSYIQSSPAVAAQTEVILHQRLLPLLRSVASSEEGIDICALFSGLTMDFVTAYIFGLEASTNFTQNQDRAKHFLGIYHSRHAYTVWPQEAPILMKMLHSLGIKVVPNFVADANAEIEAMTLKMVEDAGKNHDGKEVERNQGDTPVVYEQLNSSLSNDKGSKLLGQEQGHLTIASEMLDHLAAGFDTSSITLTYLCWELSRHPGLQSAVRMELRTLQPPLSAKSAGRLPSAKDVDALPLLSAILQETLRLHAAIPGAQPRITPPGGCQIGSSPSYTIPGDIRISAQVYSLHRNANIFSNPLTFDPSRWLDSTGNFSPSVEQARWFWAFGSGGRMCIGSNLAMNMMKFIVAALYTNFETTVVNDEGIEQEDAYTARPVGNRLIVKIKAVS